MRRPERLAATLAITALWVVSAPPARAAADPQAQAESRLMCYCGCTDLTVKVCNCGTAANIKSDIAARLAGGASVDQVVDAYVAQYGEQIRSAPTREGFNLLAWIMPFAAILAGGFMIVTLVRRWQRQPGAKPTTALAAAGASAGAGGAVGTPRTSAAEARLRERVEHELKEHL